MKSLKRRLFAKTCTYKLATYLSSVAVFGFATGSLGLAAGAATILLACNTIIYVAHEAAWNRVKWGRQLSVREMVEKHGLTLPSAEESQERLDRFTDKRISNE